MKRLLLISAFGLLVACSTPAEANDVADDGKCLDDIQHYNHLTKTTSASDEDKAADSRSLPPRQLQAPRFSSCGGFRRRDSR